MVENRTEYFRKTTELPSSDAVLTMTRQLQRDIASYMNYSHCDAACRRILERSDALLTLLEYELWVNTDDGK